MPKSEGPGELRVRSLSEDAPFTALELKRAVLQLGSRTLARPETKAAPEFVREHAQGLIGAAFQAIVPALRRALTPTDPDRAGE